MGQPSGKASGGVYLSDNSYGHTGFTGTSLWIDPDNGIIVILLTNAIHPKEKVKIPSILIGDKSCIHLFMNH